MGPSLHDENNREWVTTGELVDDYKWMQMGARVPLGIYCSHGRSDLVTAARPATSVLTP